MATIPEITDRLEAATEKAENASQIMYDVANGDATTEVPTATGPTPTLKKWFQDLGSSVEPMLAGIPARLDKAILSYGTLAEAQAAQVTAMAQLASNASSSAQQAFDNAALSEQYKIDAQQAAATAGSIAGGGGMENAIAFASTFTAVPATNQGPMVVVTLPHLRFMVWNGTKYVRAPWNMPGVLFFSHAPAANVTHGIQVRADVTYNKADYPDLAEILGVSGSTFVLPEGRARVLRAADNGRGIDTALVNGYLQEDAIRNLSGVVTKSVTQAAVFETAESSGPFYPVDGNFKYANLDSIVAANSSPIYPRGIQFDASRQVPTAAENRVKSLSATLYITK